MARRSGTLFYVDSVEFLRSKGWYPTIEEGEELWVDPLVQNDLYGELSAVALQCMREYGIYVEPTLVLPDPMMW